MSFLTISWMSKEGCSFHYYLKVFKRLPLRTHIRTSLDTSPLKTETVSPALRISVSISARLGEDWASCARNTVNSLYSGQCSSVVWCSNLKLVSFVARVRNSGSLFQSNVCNLFLPGIYLLSVLSGCPL